MYLKALPAPVPDTGTFDRAGIWINASPKGFKFADLTAEGPAAKAGLKAGEDITAVDGSLRRRSTSRSFVSDCVTINPAQL